MEARLFAQTIAEKFGTNDVYEIARAAGVSIIYASWHPTTFGEYNHRTKTIHVNRRALETAENSAGFERKIIAHELGHFFARGLKMNKEAEEISACEFAENLTGNIESDFRTENCE